MVVASVDADGGTKIPVGGVVPPCRGPVINASIATAPIATRKVAASVLRMNSLLLAST